MKIGAGVQGQTNFAELDRSFSRYLILQGDQGYIQQLGERAWYRPVGRITLSNPYADAAATARDFAPLYAAGCRNLVYPNEVIGVEGLGDTQDDYYAFNNWGVNFVTALSSILSSKGMGDVRFWTPALSPGHREDDDFEGYRLLKDYLSHPFVYGIAAHYYWRPDGGFLSDWDGQWWSKRIERARTALTEIGIDKPFAVTEYNRKVNRGSTADIQAYCQQVRDYNAYLASLGYVEASFVFLATNRDVAFDDLSLSKMPGALSMLQGLKDSIPDTPVQTAQPVEGPVPDSGPTIDPRIVDSFRTLLVNQGGSWQADKEAILCPDGSWVQDVACVDTNTWYVIREWPNLPEPGRGPTLYVDFSKVQPVK